MQYGCKAGVCCCHNAIVCAGRLALAARFCVAFCKGCCRGSRRDWHGVVGVMVLQRGRVQKSVCCAVKDRCCESSITPTYYCSSGVGWMLMESFFCHNEKPASCVGC